MRLLFLLPMLLAFALLLSCASALRFYLNDGDRRCFTFEADANTLMHGTALADAGTGTPELDVLIKSGIKGASPVFSGRMRGVSKFSFRTPISPHHTDMEGGNYDDYDMDEDDQEDVFRSSFSACVTLMHARGTEPDRNKRAVTFHVRPADQRESGEAAAGEKNVRSVTLAMREMHETLGQLTKDINLLQKRERKLLRRNRKVGTRVVRLAVFAIFVLIGTAALQVVYFMSFFKQKKLL